MGNFFIKIRNKKEYDTSADKIIRDIEGKLVAHMVKICYLDSNSFEKFMHLAKKEIDDTQNDFLRGYHAEFAKYRNFTDKADPQDVKKLEREPKLQSLVNSGGDKYVLGEAVALQRRTRLKCIVATLDYNHMIKNADLIERILGVRCIDPLYILTALYYFARKRPSL